MNILKSLISEKGIVSTKISCIFYFVCWILISLLGGSPLRAEETSEGMVPFINGGEVVAASDPIALGTVMLETDTQYCSGSLISNEAILTAAHCLEQTGEGISIYFGGLESQLKIFTKSYKVHEEYQDVKDSDYRHDIALIFFKGGIPGKFQPVDLPESKSSQVEVGEFLTLAGYGQGGPLGTLRKLSLPVTGTLNTMSLIKFNQTTKVGICHGDSGGPAFRRVGGKLVLVGITSYAFDSSCDGFSVYTRTGSYLDWIHKNLVPSI